MLNHQEEALSQRSTRLKVGRWTVMPACNQIEHDSDATKLDPHAMALLIYLAKAHERVVSAEELRREVWQGRALDDGIVYRKINQLRKALGDDPSHPQFIETIPKRGYRLIATVEPIDRDAIRGPAAAIPSKPATQARRMPFGVGLTLAFAALVAVALWRSSVTPSPRLGVVAATPPLTADAGDEIEPSWHPDGARVAFAWDRGAGRTGIYLTEAGSTQRVPLTQAPEGAERNPRWSPDGTQIAFLRQRTPNDFDLVLISALGGAERTLTEIKTPFFAMYLSLFTWTPDGKGLVLANATRGATGETYALQVLSLDSGSIEPLGLAADSDHYDRSPALSRDGKRLAFVRHRLGQRLPVLMVQELAPGLRPIGAPVAVPGLPPQESPFWPTWSPDGMSLTFAMGQQIYEWEVGGSARVAHAVPLAIGGLDVSWPDGRARAAISVAQSNLDIWALPLDPQRHVAVGPAAPRIVSTALERHMSFSPDGRQLAYVSAISGRGQLFVADADGRYSRQLTKLPSLIVSTPRWSPDGGQIAFHATSVGEPNAIYTIELDAGPPRRQVNGSAPNWSADGQHLYVARREEDRDMLVRVRLADRHQEPWFEGGGGVETVDGRDILYSKVNVFGIFARTLAGNPADNPERRLVDDYIPARAAIVPVASGFYYLGHTAAGWPRAFRFYDYETRRAHDVAPAPASIDIGMAISHDGRELLFAAQAEGSGFDLTMLEFDAL